MELDILTAEDAAKLLQVDAAIVVHLLEAAEIPGRIIDGSWRTTRRALASFVDGVPLQAGSCCGPMACCPGGACGKACC